MAYPGASPLNMRMSSATNADVRSGVSLTSRYWPVTAPGKETVP
jgi:hypothetical protein